MNNSEPNSLEQFIENMPEHVDLTVRLDKDVWIRMYELTQEDTGGFADERQVIYDWIIGAIRHYQRGVEFFYEDEATAGIPSVRFLNEKGERIGQLIYKENSNDNSTTD
jgi:hypothetical protein